MRIRLLVMLLALPAVAGAQPRPASDVVQPIAGVDPYVRVPGATFLASNDQVYRVLFEATRGAKSPNELVPAVNMAGTELNTLAAHGVKRRNVEFVLVFHAEGADEAVLDDAHYRAKHGVANPNLPVLAALRRQGVKIYVCGQQLLADKVPLAAVSKEATLVEDGVVVVMTYGGRGFAHLTF
jgi:intracellular sulfur oxidation DsrE/DsrF family protein